MSEFSGLKGLANLGNTCFLNSCMQVLSHTPELTAVLGKNIKKKTPDASLLNEWANLQRELHRSESKIVIPHKFVKTVQIVAGIKNNDLFTGFAQNDVAEFLIFVIDCFHNALSRETKMTINGTARGSKDELAVKCYEMVRHMYSKDYSEVWSVFYGIQVSEISGPTIKKIYKPEPFFILDLPLPQVNEPSLIDCFNLFVETESIDGYENEKTKLRETIQKRITFWSLPTILVIDLKRFNSRNQKKQNLVSFPLIDLDLSPYVSGYSPSKYKYDLYGVCNHSGGALGGHYTAYVKVANGKWYHFNDTSVSEVHERVIVSTKAYCLFYRMR
jgi:ubiquitin carboxyl-terminal hydrolase 8